jgi:hypothetical protein
MMPQEGVRAIPGLRSQPLARRCALVRSVDRSRRPACPPPRPTWRTATATDLLALYRSGMPRPLEATQAVLARIDALNPELKAFCLVAHDDALAAARASTARWQAGARWARWTACRCRSRT